MKFYPFFLKGCIILYIHILSTHPDVMDYFRLFLFFSNIAALNTLNTDFYVRTDFYVLVM